MSVMSPLSNLAAVELRAELDGRLRNLGKLKHWCMAVAEGVKNAMDALEESRTENGIIEVEIIRSKEIGVEGTTKAVSDIIIRDNGVGFNDENFKSFCTPDSVYKQRSGGKGLGRLVCLQAFEKVDVVSSFKNGAGWKRREIRLQGHVPVISQNLTSLESAAPDTEVRLLGLSSEYTSTAAIEFTSFADWLIEHFLPSLVEKPKWLSGLIVKEGERKMDLTTFVQGVSAWTADFTLGKYDFRARCFGLAQAAKSDQVRLVAGGRIVNSNTRDIDYYLPHLESVSEKGSHVVLLYSPFFDEHVNDARNGVSFAEEGEELALLGFTAAQLRTAVGDALKEKMPERLTQCEQQLRAQIREVVRKESPFYMPVVEDFFQSKEFDDLSISSRPEVILASMDAYRRRQVTGFRKESKRLVRLKAENAGYAEAAVKFAGQIENQKKVALAEYISLRKILLDRLDYLMGEDADGQVAKESQIHDLIFAQRTNNESGPQLDHQLWMIDERLESNVYLASDEPVDGKIGDRPDLLIALDHPSAFASDPSPKAKGYDRIAIVEFKRALKDLATAPTDDLPHRQMMRYARQIENGKAVHAGNKRPIKVACDVRYYMYAVCELGAELLQRLVSDENFTPSPTGDGAFGVMNNGRYYVEYIDLEKLLEDARARNMAFFRRLGLET